MPTKDFAASKDDQIRIRVHKEGKAFTKKVKVEKPGLGPSAFTTQYNAFAAKSANKEPKSVKRHGGGHIYTEKLPPLLDKQTLGKTYKSASQGASTYKQRRQN